MARRVGAVGAVAVSMATALGALVVLTSGQPPATGAAAGSETEDPPAPTAPASSSPESVPEQVPKSLPAVPVGAEAHVGVVGPGGTVSFSGVCPVVDGVMPGPVQVWITRVGDGGGAPADLVVTDLSAESWVYEWTAPTDPALFGSYRFVFWCGDPSGVGGPSPDDLAVTIDMVATGTPPTPPTTSTTVPAVEQEPPVPAVTPVPPVAVLPETS